MIDQNKLNEIRQGLKRYYGSYGKVAKRAKVSVEMVRLVLKGHRTSANVVEAATSVLLELEYNQMMMRREVDNRLEQIRSYRPVAMNA